MDNQFVPKEFEKILISLGFDYTQRVHLIFKEKKYYGILWQQAFDWFRNEYNLCSWIYKRASRPYKYHYSILKDARVYVESDNNKSTYEEARLECLKKLIEIVKNK